MKTKFVMLAAGLFLALSSGYLRASIVTIEITGHVTHLGGYTAAIPDAIYEEMTFIGSYTYDSSTPDSGGGHYWHSAPYGISISMGGYEFKTIPNHIDHFEIRIANDIVGNGITDIYSVRSEHENISTPSSSFSVRSIRWDLLDSTYSAIASNDLPIGPPVLADWDSNNLMISGSDFSTGFSSFIQGTVTQAVLVPEPLAISFLATGFLFLKRRR